MQQNKAFFYILDDHRNITWFKLNKCVSSAFAIYAEVVVWPLCFPNFQGKTLAFVLPILESLTNGALKASRKTGYGRSPSVIVLLPTRELATQV